ncbi:phosphatidate cytidylyltransferase [Mycoplasmopsis canis]|uniref:phosphatidate cytidylyltransferase n=1 Tax=Mycoplasmopsis canis TaxID=29555 RepID=UPI000A4A2072|nr:phosphatidate cytidylyltransferase [Mycoplasmopsis canis]
MNKINKEQRSNIFKERVIPAILMTLFILVFMPLIRYSFYWSASHTNNDSLYWFLICISLIIVFALAFWAFFELAKSFLKNNILAFFQASLMLLSLLLWIRMYDLFKFQRADYIISLNLLHETIIYDYIYWIILFVNVIVFVISRALDLGKQTNVIGLLRNALHFFITFLVISAFFKTFLFLNLIKSGIFYILLFVIISVAHDIGGFFGGMFFGHKFFKNKLAPTISPKKTYEGAIVGILSSIIISIIFSLSYYGGSRTHAIDNDLISLLTQGGGRTIVLIVFLVLAPIFALTGDLYFSFVKRTVEIKDFSRILRGHGGLLDRIDSITFVFFLFLILSRAL